jgi:hypothetical protein
MSEATLGSTTAERAASSDAVYELEGTLLEVCTCGVLCPCWVGEDPDGGTCKSVNAYHFDRGTIRGVDVTGRSLAVVTSIPGNVLTPASWKVALYIDDGATDEQFEAIRAAYTGELGGLLGDLAGLIAEVVTVERVPMVHEVRGGAGTLRVGDFAAAEMSPFRDPSGEHITTLRDSLFSTVPGSPAYVSKASHAEVNLPQYGIVWSAEGGNAIQSDYRIVHAA